MLSLVSCSAGARLSFFVRATDSGNPPHQTEVSVELHLLPPPESSSIPRFSHNHYSFSIAEDAAIGTVIGRLQLHEQAAGEHLVI